MGDDDDRLSWSELQRRALLAGVPATLPRGELEERLDVDGDEDDAEEPRLRADGGVAATSESDDSDPESRLDAAREEIRAALADLDVDDGTIRVADRIFVSAHGDRVTVEIDGSVHEFDREFAALLGMCTYVAAAR